MKQHQRNTSGRNTTFNNEKNVVILGLDQAMSGENDRSRSGGKDEANTPRPEAAGTRTLAAFHVPRGGGSPAAAAAGPPIETSTFRNVNLPPLNVVKTSTFNPI